MNKEEYLSGLESVLFFWADPIDLDSLAKILEVDKKFVLILIEELSMRYQSKESGLELKKVNDSYQLVTKKENNTFIEKMIVKESEKRLSNSLMETLAIIAYKQPVTRIEIDSIRGVNSSSSIATLIDRGLIEERGRLDAIGKPILYGTTDEFLRIFNLESIENLPKEAMIKKEFNAF